MVRLESSVEQSFTRAALKLGCMILKLNVRGRRGWPDRLILMPMGKMALFEFKRPRKKKLEVLQDAVRDDLRKIGHTVYVFNDAAEALRTLKQLMKGIEFWTYPTAKRANSEAELYEMIVGRPSSVLGKKKR